MQILIINLPRHTDRLAFQQTQMARLGLSFKLTQAVDAAALPNAAYEQWSQTWERPLSKAEVCCFLSHRNAWQHVVDSDEPTLVLEDDAVLADSTLFLLTKLAELQNTDRVVLEIRGRKKILGKQTRPVTPDFGVLELFQDRTGSAGYVIWPCGARKLLDKAEQGLAAPSDAFMSSHYALRAWQVEPAALIQLDMCEHYGLPQTSEGEPSSIGLAGRPSSQRKRWVFTYRRLMAQLRIGWRILRVLHKAERRHVRLDRKFFRSGLPGH